MKHKDHLRTLILAALATTAAGCASSQDPPGVFDFTGYNDDDVLLRNIGEHMPGPMMRATLGYGLASGQFAVPNAEFQIRGGGPELGFTYGGFVEVDNAWGGTLNTRLLFTNVSGANTFSETQELRDFSESNNLLLNLSATNTRYFGATNAFTTISAGPAYLLGPGAIGLSAELYAGREWRMDPESNMSMGFGLGLGGNYLPFGVEDRITTLGLLARMTMTLD